MENLKLSWTKVEFMAYLLIYAAQINQIETEEEKEFIGSRFDSKLLKKIYKQVKSLVCLFVILFFVVQFRKSSDLFKQNAFSKVNYR